MAFPFIFRVAALGLAVAAAKLGPEADDVSCLQMPMQTNGTEGAMERELRKYLDGLAQNGTAEVTNAGCDLMVLTTFFSTKKDWQRNVSAPPKFQMMKQFYESAIEQGINVTVLYDELPEEILLRETEHFKFQRVALENYDAEEGLNDVRFNMIRDLVQERPEWRNLFLVDLFDVKVGMNPCGQMADGKLYVGQERDRLSHNGWMKKRFLEMGGRYEAWFDNDVRRTWFVMNAGIVGGRRDVFTSFLKEMTDVLNDPELTARKLHQQENVNMAALNYVVRVSMGLDFSDEEGKPGFVSGGPVHSEYKRYESDRKDVWFIHK